jgi:hypothetical protein
MKTPTPFLPHLSGLLFGRPSRPARERLLQEAQQLQRASLGKLTGLFGQYIPSALLEPATRGPGSRQRLFSIRTTFWAFLAQILNPQGSCREALRKLQAWQAACTAQTAGSGTSAYCQARGRLPVRVLMQIHERVAREVDRKSLGDEEFGRPVKVVDGTSASMPDTQANQALWPQTKAQKPGCGFPFVRLVGLFNLGNGVLIDWAEGSKHDHESKLFRSLWKHLRGGDLLVGDRGFCSYATLAQLRERGVDSLMRIHQARGFSFAQGKRLGLRDRLIHWKRPVQPLPGWSRAQWNTLPSTLALRLVEIRVQRPGFRVRSYVVVTTLLDPISWPVERLGRLYFRRWVVELFFRDIKISMGMDVLRCKSPAMVRREIIMHAIAYNCIRGVMQRAASTYQTPLERISFKGTVDALRQWADAIHIHHGKPRKQAEMIDTLLRLVSEDYVPYRPGRVEPRARKRRAKGYQLMNKPRAQMVVSASRRWK